MLPLAAVAVMCACGGPGASAGSAGSGFVETACRTTPEGYTVCEPSGYLPPGATPPPPPTVVVADTAALGGVPLGTDAASAARRLTTLWGEPVVEEQSCLRESLEETLAQPVPGRRLAWDELHAFVSESPSGRVALTGWEVRSPRSRARFDVRLPYGTRVGDQVRDVLRRTPRARGSVADTVPDAGSFVVRTDEVPSLLWYSHEQDDEGEVHGAAYDPEGCR